MADISLHYSSHAPLAGTIATLRQIVGTWSQRARERNDLARLDERSLRDLGLDPGNIDFEINKPFWRG